MKVHIGLENYVDGDRVLTIMKYRGATMMKLKKIAIKDGRFYSLTGPEPLRSLLLMDNGIIIGSCITSKTLCSRMNGPMFPVAMTERAQAQALADDDESDNDEYRLDETYAAESSDDEDEEEVDDDEEDSDS